VGWSNQAVTLIVLEEDAAGFSGLFAYSPTAGPGNLFFSVAANSGTDPYGNSYGAGLEIGDFTGGRFTVDTTGRWFLFDAANQEIFEGSGPDGSINNLDTSGNLQACFGLVSQGLFGLVGPSIGWEPGATGVTPESWHTVTIPASWTGSARVKMLSQTSLACFDCSITAPAAGATSGVFGTFPAAAYYPQTLRAFAAGFTGSSAGTNARLLINTSGSGPSFAGLPAGFTGTLAMTCIYPTD
jgi:hypothetical protein